jgi:predicted nucleic acid-binding protein
MNYLLDTNHWSYLQRRHPAVLARIRQLPQEATLYMPVVAQAALLAGVELAVDARRKEKLRSPYE